MHSFLLVSCHSRPSQWTEKRNTINHTHMHTSIKSSDISNFNLLKLKRFLSVFFFLNIYFIYLLTVKSKTPIICIFSINHSVHNQSFTISSHHLIPSVGSYMLCWGTPTREALYLSPIWYHRLHVGSSHTYHHRYILLTLLHPWSLCCTVWCSFLSRTGPYLILPNIMSAELNCSWRKSMGRNGKRKKNSMPCSVT